MRNVRSSPVALDSIWNVCDPPGREHLVELAAQQLGGLAVQDLEDRPADRLLARHALHSGLALAVPGLNAVFAVDHVETDGKRVDDLLGEATLLLDLLRAEAHLDRHLLRVLGVGDRRGQQVGNGGEDNALLGVERAVDTQHENAQQSLAGDQPDEHGSLVG